MKFIFGFSTAPSKKEKKLNLLDTDKEYNADEIGILKLEKKPKNEISAGNVGYLISGIKVASEVHVGDTITNALNPGEALKGFEKVKPMVFAGIYPVDTTEFEELRSSMEKLQLNDASLVWELGNISCSWIWFPMWIPGHVAHGDYPGTTGTRIQHDGNHHCTVCSIPGIFNGRFADIY